MSLKKGFKLYVPIVVILLIGYLIYYNRFSIYHRIVLARYKVPSLVNQLATQDTMTPISREIFYINHPTFLTKVNFSKECPNFHPAEEIILGCYYPNENGIYILNVSDPTLNGIMQVTAAHEMLHGVYSRLSSSQKKTLDSLLLNFYLHDLTDQRIRDEVAIYMKTEPGSVYDEMNSTFPTECQKLTPQLETFYKKYFYNRLQVVAYEQAYQQVFLNKKNQLASYDSTLNSMNATITQQQNQAKTMYQSLNSQLTYINSHPSDSNIFNLVNSYNNQVNQYNNLVKTISVNINQYNQLVNQRNQISIALVSLETEISPPTIPTK